MIGLQLITLLPSINWMGVALVTQHNVEFNGESSEVYGK